MILLGAHDAAGAEANARTALESSTLTPSMLA